MDGESSNDYYVEMSEPETLNRKIIDVAKRGMSHIEEPFYDQDNVSLCVNNYLIEMLLFFKNFKSESIF